MMVVLVVVVEQPKPRTRSRPYNAEAMQECWRQPYASGPGLVSRGTHAKFGVSANVKLRRCETEST